MAFLYACPGAKLTIIETAYLLFPVFIFRGCIFAVCNRARDHFFADYVTQYACRVISLSAYTSTFYTFHIFFYLLIQVFLEMQTYFFHFYVLAKKGNKKTTEQVIATKVNNLRLPACSYYGILSAHL